jgi:hypothetical protein
MQEILEILASFIFFDFSSISLKVHSIIVRWRKSGLGMRMRRTTEMGAISAILIVYKGPIRF